MDGYGVNQELRHKLLLWHVAAVVRKTSPHPGSPLEIRWTAFGDERKQVETHPKTQEESTKYEENNESDWSRPEQTHNFNHQTYNYQNTRVLQPSLHWLGAQNDGPPFQNFALFNEVMP
jgi:hypothetical protein